MYLKHKTSNSKILKELKNSRTNGGKTHFFKNNSRPNKIQEHSRISRTSGHFDYTVFVSSPFQVCQSYLFASVDIVGQLVYFVHASLRPSLGLLVSVERRSVRISV